MVGEHARYSSDASIFSGPRLLRSSVHLHPKNESKEILNTIVADEELTIPWSRYATKTV